MTPKATAKEFFVELFRDLDGVVPIVTSNIETGEFPHTEVWFPVENLCNGDAEMPDHDTPWQVYFTPHTYATDQSRHKRNASKLGGAVWIECDDEHFSFLTITEAQPSVVVQTSPGRQHLYWFLDEPTDLETIQEVNKSLTYKYLKRDRSGWDISQLLRVPGYENRKREQHNPVEIVEWAPGRRYNLMQTFGQLPAVDNADTFGNRDSDVAIPTTIPTREEVEKKYGGNFNQSFDTLRATTAADRSGALWQLYHRCIEMDMSPVETYALLRQSPNDKFSKSRYNGERELWNDINSAYRMVKDGVPETAREEIEAARKAYRMKQCTRDQERQMVAEIVRKDLAGQGGFYYDEAQKRVVYFRHRQLINIDQRAILFRAILDRVYNINPIADEFAYTVEHIKNYVVQDGQRVTLHDTCYYNHANNLLYIDDRNGGMFRLDGDKIEHLDIGVDDVMFSTNELADPIVCQPVREDNDESPLDKYVLRRPNFKTNRLAKNDIMFLYRAWMYSTFFLDKSKPMFVIEGTRGSGKSTLFKTTEQVLVGERADVTDISDNVEAVRVLIRGKHHVFLDGVEDASKQMQNLLSTVSTGSQEVKRVLYTDNEQATYDLNAALGITAMSIEYFRKDLLDRSIIVTTERFREFASIEDIRAEVRRHRPEIWTEILHDLNDMVARKATWKSQPSRLRMNNFVDLLRMLCDVKDRDFEPFVDYIGEEQDERAVNHDVLYEVLSLWLNDGKNYDRTVNAKQLHNELVDASIMPGIAYEREVKTPKQLNWKLRDLIPNLRDVEVIESKDKRGTALFTFVSLREDEPAGP